MPLHLDDCSFHGSALPESFVKLELDAHLTKADLWPRTAGAAGKAFERGWDVYRRKLNKLVTQGGPMRVINHVFEPLLDTLAYQRIERQEEVKTREALEDGGWLLRGPDDATLRVWAVDLGTDLDAPTRRSHAYRFSPQRVAERVLDACDQRVGLLTDGEELRIVLHAPARPGSHITIRLDRSGGWRRAVSVPEIRATPRRLRSAWRHSTSSLHWAWPRSCASMIPTMTSPSAKTCPGPSSTRQAPARMLPPRALPESRTPGDAARHQTSCTPSRSSCAASMSSCTASPRARTMLPPSCKPSRASCVSSRPSCATS